MNKLFAFLLSIFKAKQEMKELKKQEKTSADVKPTQKTTVEQHEDSVTITSEAFDLNKFNWSTMNTKYFKKEHILNAKQDFTISGDYNWININDDKHKSYKVVGKKLATGHLPIVIDVEGNVHRGGHSGNNICSSFKKDEFKTLLVHKPKYYFVIRVPFECNPKNIVYGISNILEVK